MIYTFLQILLRHKQEHSPFYTEKGVPTCNSKTAHCRQKSCIWKLWKILWSTFLVIDVFNVIRKKVTVHGFTSESSWNFLFFNENHREFYDIHFFLQILLFYIKAKQEHLLLKIEKGVPTCSSKTIHWRHKSCTWKLCEILWSTFLVIDVFNVTRTGNELFAKKQLCAVSHHKIGFFSLVKGIKFYSFFFPLQLLLIK